FCMGARTNLFFNGVDRWQGSCLLRWELRALPSRRNLLRKARYGRKSFSLRAALWRDLPSAGGRERESAAPGQRGGLDGVARTPRRIGRDGASSCPPRWSRSHLGGTSPRDSPLHSRSRLSLRRSRAAIDLQEA